MSNEADPLERPEIDEAPEPSLRETIEASIAEVDPDNEVIPSDAGLAPVAEVQPSSTESVPPEKTEATPPNQVAPVPGVTPPPVQAPASTELKAPAQWKPAVREKWNGLPREVQEEIHRRESDSMRLIGSVGPKIRMADEVTNHISPFMDSLSANGVTPSAFLGDVFTSIKQLSSGQPMERAEVVANMIQAYGVDLKTLDHILTKRITAPPEVLQARQMMARAAAVVQQRDAGIEHENSEKAQKAILEFAADPKHEFIADVKDMMADLIELGHAKNLPDAYQAAIWTNPDTRKILLQREAQSRADVKNKRATAARRASSAVHGAPSTPTRAVANGAGGELSLRETLNQAFDEASPL